MRLGIVSLCVMAAACSGQGLNAPTSPSVVTATRQEASGSRQTQAQRGTELPFAGSFTRESSAAFEPPITLVITGTQTGTATHLGRFTATSIDRVDTVTNTGTGTLTLTAANGDQLFATTVGAESSFIPPNISNVTQAATIVGGTGRFADATGTFTINITETIDFATNSATGSGSFEGRISLNK